MTPIKLFLMLVVLILFFAPLQSKAKNKAKAEQNEKQKEILLRMDSTFSIICGAILIAMVCTILWAIYYYL